jgi:transcriptional regulator with XRE-family HTH domain
MESTIGRSTQSEAKVGQRDLTEIPIDPFRNIVFPNRLREKRRAAGFMKLLRFAAVLPEIPYIRLSKIERGEVVARTDELGRIATALGIAPSDLLIDIDDPGFDLAEWAQPFADGKPIDDDAERFALLLAAAVRARRSLDADLTIADVEQRFGLAQVNLSRVENAAKPWPRWNAAVQSALLRLFGVADEAALRHNVLAAYQDGSLAPFLENVVDPAHRWSRSRSRIASLARELNGLSAAQPSSEARPLPNKRDAHDERALVKPSPAPRARALTVYGAPLPDGLIDFVNTGRTIDAPRDVSDAAFGLRVGRATLGGGLPGHAIVVVDPGRYPVAGGLAAVREGTAWRVVAVTIDRDGVLGGYSVNPAREVPIDGRDVAEVAAVVAALF